MGVTSSICALCGRSTGAMKCSTDGLWAHIPCVAWTPKLAFADDETLRPKAIRPILYPTSATINTSFSSSSSLLPSSSSSSPTSLPSSTITHRCVGCGKTVGVPVRCHEKGCCNYYHISCAQDAGCVLDAETTQDGVSFIILCPSHTFLPPNTPQPRQLPPQLPSPSPPPPPPSSSSSSIVSSRKQTSLNSVIPRTTLTTQIQHRTGNAAEMTEAELSAIVHDLDNVDWEELLADEILDPSGRNSAMNGMNQTIISSEFSRQESRKRDRLGLGGGFSRQGMMGDNKRMR